MPTKPIKVRGNEACEAPADETKSGEPGAAEAGLAAPIATQIGRYHDFT
jgi:hypothetical protein